MLPSLALLREKPKWLINWDWGGGESRVRDKNTEGIKTEEITKHLSDVASQYWEGTWCKKQTGLFVT